MDDLDCLPPAFFPKKKQDDNVVYILKAFNNKDNSLSVQFAYYPNSFGEKKDFEFKFVIEDHGPEHNHKKPSIGRKSFVSSSTKDEVHRLDIKCKHQEHMFTDLVVKSRYRIKGESKWVKIPDYNLRGVPVASSCSFN